MYQSLFPPWVLYSHFIDLNSVAFPLQFLNNIYWIFNRCQDISSALCKHYPFSVGHNPWSNLTNSFWYKDTELLKVTCKLPRFIQYPNDRHGSKEDGTRGISAQTLSHKFCSLSCRRRSKGLVLKGDGRRSCPWWDIWQHLGIFLVPTTEKRCCLQLIGRSQRGPDQDRIQRASTTRYHLVQRLETLGLS